MKKAFYRHLSTIAMLLLSTTNITSQSYQQHSTSPAINTMLKSMTIRQKIAQLLMPAIWLNTQNKAPHASMEPDQALALIEEYQIGGCIFLGHGTIAQLTALTQKIAALPHKPITSIDAEWGLHMRLIDAVQLPKNLTLAAIANKQLLYEFGKEVGLQCTTVGININFAPVADINKNPQNPIINMRACGDAVSVVTSSTIPIMQGLQQSVIACAKHFPGHGATDIDSHRALPIITATPAELHATELMPFKELIHTGVSSIMIGHLAVPSLDQHNPASLARTITTDLLRTTLGFDGLIVTDALNMRALTDYRTLGEIELKALLAGADILLCPVDVPQAIITIQTAVEEGLFSEEELDKRVHKVIQHKILQQKKASGNALQDVEAVYNRLHASHVYALQHKLYEHAVTHIGDHKQIPFSHHGYSPSKIHLIQIGKEQPTVCTTTVQQHCTNTGQHVHTHYIPQLNNLEDTELTIPHDHTIIICVYTPINHGAPCYGIHKAALVKLNQLAAQTNTLIALFCSPYLLYQLPDAQNIIIGYEDVEPAEQYVAQVITGKAQALGKLPITYPATNKK